jgi:hypothetical protein
MTALVTTPSVDTSVERIERTPRQMRILETLFERDGTARALTFSDLVKYGPYSATNTRKALNGWPEVVRGADGLYRPIYTSMSKVRQTGGFYVMPDTTQAPQDCPPPGDPVEQTEPAQDGDQSPAPTRKRRSPFETTNADRIKAILDAMPQDGAYIERDALCENTEIGMVHFMPVFLGMIEAGQLVMNPGDYREVRLARICINDEQDGGEAPAEQQQHAGETAAPTGGDGTPPAAPEVLDDDDPDPALRIKALETALAARNADWQKIMDALAGVGLDVLDPAVLIVAMVDELTSWRQLMSEWTGHAKMPALNVAYGGAKQCPSQRDLSHTGPQRRPASSAPPKAATS